MVGRIVSGKALPLIPEEKIRQREKGKARAAKHRSRAKRSCLRNLDAKARVRGKVSSPTPTD